MYLRPRCVHNDAAIYYNEYVMPQNRRFLSADAQHPLSDPLPISSNGFEFFPTSVISPAALNETITGSSTLDPPDEVRYADRI